MGVGKMAPRVRQHHGTRPTATNVAEGDSVDTTKSSAPAHPPKLTEEERLARLEERLRHELMPDEECQELRDRVLRL